MGSSGPSRREASHLLQTLGSVAVALCGASDVQVEKLPLNTLLIYFEHDDLQADCEDTVVFCMSRWWCGKYGEDVLVSPGGDVMFCAAQNTTVAIAQLCCRLNQKVDRMTLQ